MILGQRIRLDPNNVQATFFERCAGASRKVFNIGLARWQELYAAGEKTSWQAINAEVNARKKSDLAWLRELPCSVSSNALKDLGAAFTNFFRRVKAGEKPGYPNFKAKKRVKPAFAVDNRTVRFTARKVRVPKLGWVRTRQALRFPGKILAARFSKHAGHWYISVNVEVDEAHWSYPHRCETQAIVGADLGVRDLAVLSTGEKIEAPRVLRRYEIKQRMLNKELIRRKPGGKNWHKTKAKLGKLHERISNIRKDVTHKLTADLVRRFRYIGIEDLNIRGMAANRRIAKSVMDAAMSEVSRQLLYKAPLAGSEVVQADRWYPSSKTCSACGSIYADLVMGEERWVCQNCSTEHDRDINAAINLKNLAAAYAVTACRRRSSGDSEVRITKLPLGQESGSHVNLG